MSEKGAISAAPLPEDAARFWQGGLGMLGLRAVGVSAEPALKRLGDSPFTRAGFPVVGFLETVYEQVTGYARGRGLIGD